MTLARIDWNLSIGAGGSVANRLREGGDFEQKLTKENEGTTQKQQKRVFGPNNS